MKWPWSKNRSSPIGIDFGAESLKLLQVIPGEPVQMVAASSADLPWEENQTAGRGGVVGQILKELVRGGGFRGRRAIVSLPASQTLIQLVPVSAGADGEELKEQIAQHLRERLNVDPERMVIRWVAVGGEAETAWRRDEMICVAAEREAVLRYIELGRRAGLDVVGMAAQPVAMLRAFSHLFRRVEDRRRTTCFVDIGAETTKVVIAHGARMVFAKTIRVGGWHLFGERGRLQAVGVTGGQAAGDWLGRGSGAAGEGAEERRRADEVLGIFGGEKRVRLAGGLTVAEEGGDSLTGPGRSQNSQVGGLDGGGVVPGGGGQEKRRGLNKEARDCLVDELGLCVRFHQSQYPERAVEKLVFLGGVSQELGVCRAIAQELGIAAQLGDPLARLVRGGPGGGELDLRKPQPGWAVAMGLCLTEPDI